MTNREIITLMFVLGGINLIIVALVSSIVLANWVNMAAFGFTMFVAGIYKGNSYNGR